MNPYDGYRSWKGWTDRPFGGWSLEAGVYFSQELKRSDIKNMVDMSVLEIGCGNGDFAGWARHSGAQYVGTELICELVEKGVAAGFDVRHASEPLQRIVADQSVDLIVAFDVFEHLDTDALRTTLHSCHRALRQSGRLIARVPSGDSPFSGSIQHGDATHRSTLGSSAVRQLAHASGFEVAAVREPALPLWGLGLRSFLRRAVVRGLRAVTFPVITRIFMGGDEAVLTPNMLFVLRKV